MEEIIERLKENWICNPAPFKEGEVSVLEEKFTLEKEAEVNLWISALGMYEAEMDEVKVGDELFSPGFTYYPLQVQYQVYPLSLEKGEHTLRVYLGQGWYAGRFTFDNKVQIYGEKPAVSWLIEMNQTVLCDSGSGVSLLQSPYSYAGLYDGEIYKEGMLLTREEKPVPFTGKLPKEFVKRNNAVRLREEMPVVKVIPHETYCILDFGQNFAGVVTIDPGKMNTKQLKLRHGELLNSDGSLYTANLRKAKQEIIYEKDDENLKLYTPRFTYMGFRYIELSGCDYQEGLITAHAIYSDMERTGYFHCENEKIQRLYENQIWGQKSNYVEIPTDCPQRDERMGYTGDGHVFARSGAYNFDTRSFLKKFINDMQVSQKAVKDGYIPSTVPALPGAKIGFLNMLGWGNAITLIPEMMEEQFSEEVLTDCYESICRFVNLEIKKCKLTGLWEGVNLGDWLMVGKDMKYMAQHHGPVSNSFVVHDFRVAKDLAKKLGYNDDAKHFEKAYQRTRKAYIKRYIKPTGEMKDDYQGAYVMALKWVLDSSDSLYDKVYKHLREHLVKEGMQTGFFASEHLLPILCDNRDERLAYDILFNEKCPGWLYEINHGATTIWERWDAIQEDGSVNESKMADDNMVSFNHYAFGSVAEFLYRYVLGIEPKEKGFKKLKFQPKTDGRLGFAQGSYQSVSGKITSSWKYEGDVVTVKLTTPVETEVLLEDGTEKTVAPGSYEFSYKKEGSL